MSSRCRCRNCVGKGNVTDNLFVQFGLQDPIAFATCKVVAQPSQRVKIYVEGESQCWNEVLPGVVEEGVRQLTHISDTHRYFVVVANVDPHDEQAYDLAIE